MKFKLEIQLGNDEMQNLVDVAKKLRDLAWDLAIKYEPSTHHGPYTILDNNGNTVGSWKVTKK